MDVSTGTEILERNDDLLSEILLRLPSRSLFKFTCVSTRWNNAITNRLFKKLYSERAGKTLTCSYPHGRLLAMVQTDNKYSMFSSSSGGFKHNFMPVRGEDVGAARCDSEFLPIERGYFITSSKDGLILCGIIPEIYYVGSPITGNWETLPPPPPPPPAFPGRWETHPPPPQGFPDYILSVGLSSNEDDDTLGGKMINFRVVVAIGGKANYMGQVGPNSKVIPIQTYSSRRREWRISELISNIPVRVNHFTPPIFSGGFLHWITNCNGYIVAYDPSLLDEEDDDNRNVGSVPRKKQKQHQHVVQVIRTPHNEPFPILWRSDNGQTIWYGVSGLFSGVHIFQKRDDNDEWGCICRFAPTGPNNAVTRNMLGITQADIDRERTLCGLDSDDEGDEDRSRMWVIAFIPWDPNLVMLRHWDRFYVYDCMQNKLDHEVLLDGEGHVTVKPWDWYPFFHTLSKSPYNLNPQTQSK